MSSQEENVAKIIAKAGADKAYRAALLKDPVAAIEAELALELPKNLKVKVLEDTPSLVHFAIPADYRYKGEAPGKIHKPVAHADPARQKRQDLYLRVWEDAAFKKKLLAQPKEILSRELGLTWPAGTEVKVFEDTERLVHLVLPRGA